MAKRILQFGTSRFLQAHADLFVHQARQQGQDIGPITVVKTTLGGARDSRVKALSEMKKFPVHLKGFEKGKLVDEVIYVESVCAAFDANADWKKLLGVFAAETDIVISNVGDSGYELAQDDDVRRASHDSPPRSFPAKLLSLLMRRFEKGAGPLLILPCELISGNGRVLRQVLTGLAGTWQAGPDFTRWLETSVVICDTLVDRIVSESIEPIGAVAEPYGLWAIKTEAGLEPPFLHPCITYTDDLEPFMRLKLHILNLGHTFLAGIWRDEKRAPHETVREMLCHAGVRDRLVSLYQDEVIPGFAARGMKEEATRYVATTLERFENPFLNHLLSDIAQNHAVKIERRIVEFISWVRSNDSSLRLARLEAIASA